MAKYKLLRGSPRFPAGHRGAVIQHELKHVITPLRVATQKKSAVVLINQYASKSCKTDLIAHDLSAVVGLMLSLQIGIVDLGWSSW